MSKTIKIDFEKMYNDTINYFSHLSSDMIFAWAAVGIGLILIIVGLVVM
ncbi:TPA: hypothetical protein HA235_05380 [Candidatus Woesearchaeota archaeon]|nr:hypothetical protein [uncultured archaeon]HIH32112.1 hypothetical protein [Candidatus Woesearchaeota archaeon]HIH54889.1 hypothetical protein [Candidatus Woesearchaeota archaeon]HIJ02451.1 hypothetical protein [Candidatus Woesearchaeota archaeon]HIJ13717.1 hypothetical protein [Candidatus Woesearchaeota archaeon]